MMKLRTILVCGLAFVGSWSVTTLLREKEVPAPEQKVSTPSVREIRRPEALFRLSPIHVIDPQLSLRENREVLRAQGASRQKIAAFLGEHIGRMSFDEMLETIMNGEEVTKREAWTMGQKMTYQDPERIFDLVYRTQSLKIQDTDVMGNFFYAVMTNWIWHHDPKDFFGELAKMPHSEYAAGAFSYNWAAIDPAAVADYFDSIVRYRNPANEAHQKHAERNLANLVTKHWNKKDRSALDKFIEKLPPGGKREAFEKAVQKIDQSAASK